MNILNRIESPADVKELNAQDTDALCAQIREFLIKSVAKTGGHLASNLGVVELTVAIHKVFDTSKDRLVFDVGHQSYVHKILTGRRSQFDTLRQFGGISGFSKPSESIHDAVISGHASNSISAALGIARARTLSRDNYCSIALIGDGALTGGLAFEGLSDAGASGEPIIIILNDNGMSITKNVGGVASYLARQRLKPSYSAFKKKYRRLMDILPGGRAIYNFTHKTKVMIKEAILHCSMFEEMGLQYSGAIDGHNVNRVVEALQWAKKQDVPTVVHIITTKGKGYEFSEQSPEYYHGVGPFNHMYGVEDAGESTFSSVFGNELVRIANDNPKVCAITASMTTGTGLTKFANRHPERFFDTGIAEGHAVTMAAGMASQGAIPVFAVYSSFLQRSYDMLLHDVAISGLHVIFAIDRAGLVAGDGETHQGIYDIAYLSSVPGITIFCPSSFAELRDMLRHAIDNIKGPIAVRYPRGEEGRYKDGGTDDVKLIREGRDFTLVTYGETINIALDAADMLEKENYSIEIIKPGRVYPLDFSDIKKSVKKTKRLLVLEECSARGSISELIGTTLTSSSDIELKSFVSLNVGNTFIPSGEVDELRKLCQIDAQSVSSAIKQELNPTAIVGGSKKSDITLNKRVS